MKQNLRIEIEFMNPLLKIIIKKVGVCIIHRDLSFLINILIIVISIMPITNSIAEEKFCLPPKSCELSMQQKIQNDYADARLVALGSFELNTKDSTPEQFSDNESFINVAFAIKKIVKGKVSSDVIYLKIPIYSPQKNAKSFSLVNVEELFDQYSNDVKTLEGELEDGKIDKERYIKGLNRVRTPIIGFRDYLSKFVIVPIKRGGLDSLYRITDMPLKFGKGNRYALFLFRDLSTQGATPLFPTDLDLYEESIRIPSP